MAVDLADRTRRAVAAAVDAAMSAGLRVEAPRVLHDVFSVVVHLAPSPVVARIPVVIPPGSDPDRRAARQQRELDVATWLAAQGVPVAAPSSLVPRVPVRKDDFTLTFWELADVAADHQPYHGVDIAHSARLHAALASYPDPLPFLVPFTEGLPDMVAALPRADVLAAADIDRVLGEFHALNRILADRACFAAAFPDVAVQPIQGDAPSHNVIRTSAGILFSDFEDVGIGPVEWDLAMLGTEAIADYDRAADIHGVRRTDPRVQHVMDRARLLQFIACFTLIPQLPVLADGLLQALEQFRAMTRFQAGN